MERTITINIGNLIDKLEISNSGCVNLENLETSIQDALLKAVNFASFEHVEKSDTAKEVNSSKSRLSEERAYRENGAPEENKDIDEIIIKREFTKRSKHSYISKVEGVTVIVSSKEFNGRLVFNQYSDYKDSRIKKAIDMLLGKHDTNTSGNISGN